MYIIKIDGTVEDYKPKHKRITLEEMQEIVDGYIEIIRLQKDNKLMIVNDEGLLNNLPVNEKASALYIANGGKSPYIVGNVLIADNGDID